MYNLNVNVTTNLPNFLGLDGQANTPRTPEIVSSVMAMTNPFEALAKAAGERNSPGSEESCSGTGSPLGSPISSPPSLQHTRSQLIKEGLKLTIQTKRKQSGSDTKEDLEEFESKRTKREELTAEDEERRKRRRERNKIAATKCRMKKREKTANLVNESEMLETQNIDLKAQIEALEKQKEKLVQMLSMHAPCVKSADGLQQGQFAEYGAESAAFIAGFDADAGGGFGEAGSEFEVGSTNGTSALSPFSKDPSFGNSAAYPARGYHLSGYGNDFYQQKQKGSEDGRASYEYQSDEDGFKKSRKVARDATASGYRPAGRKGGGGGAAGGGGPPEPQSHEFRTTFHHHHHHHHHHCDDSDSYKPNGIIDGNFFANRGDVFAGSDYAAGFAGANALDNGCMA